MSKSGEWSFVKNEAYPQVVRHTHVNLLMTAHTVLMFTSVICKWGQPVRFPRTGTALRSFTNIACHSKTFDLAKHLSSYASFHLESVSITDLPTNAIFYRNALLSHSVLAFHQKKRIKRSTNSKIEHQFQYATKCVLYSVDCSSLTRMTCTYLRYQLARCTTHRQVIIPVLATLTSQSSRSERVPKTTFTKTAVT